MYCTNSVCMYITTDIRSCLSTTPTFVCFFNHGGADRVRNVYHIHTTRTDSDTKQKSEGDRVLKLVPNHIIHEIHIS